MLAWEEEVIFMNYVEHKSKARSTHETHDATRDATRDSPGVNPPHASLRLHAARAAGFEVDQRIAASGSSLCFKTTASIWLKSISSHVIGECAGVSAPHTAPSSAADSAWTRFVWERFVGLDTWMLDSRVFIGK